MAILKFLGKVFLLPGNLVLAQINVTEEQDGGVFRSMINMLFWGLIAVLVMLPFV